MPTKKKKPAASPGNGADQENQVLRAALADIAAESWRFGKALEKVLRRMDPMEAERFERQYSYFSSRVMKAASSAGLVCLDLTGQPYDPGMALQAMNLEEFGEDDPLIVTRMIEPVILWDGRVMKTGMAMLDRIETETEGEPT